MRIILLILSLILSLGISQCKQRDPEKPTSVSLEDEPTLPLQKIEQKEKTKPPVSNAPAKELTIGPHKVIAKNGLMLRTEPKKDSPAIVRMDKDVLAEILEYTEIEDEFEGNRARWAKVKFKKYTGWAFTFYLEPQKGSTKVSSKPE